MDDTTLLIDFLRFEQQTVSPVVENKQTRVNNIFVARRYITYIIYSLGDTCIGIEVGAKLNTLRLTPSEDSITWEMLSAIEAHVLKEMGKTALRLLLLNRTYLLGDVELCTVFRPCIVTDVIS